VSGLDFLIIFLLGAAFGSVLTGWFLWEIGVRAKWED
jgi:hypothetical protein